jgi:hypothetical protein
MAFLTSSPVKKGVTALVCRTGLFDTNHQPGRLATYVHVRTGSAGCSMGLRQSLHGHVMRQQQ